VRHMEISRNTAKTDLDLVRAKYEHIGRHARTELELSDAARSSGFPSSCENIRTASTPSRRPRATSESLAERAGRSPLPVALQGVVQVGPACVLSVEGSAY